MRSRRYSVVKWFLMGAAFLALFYFTRETEISTGPSSLEEGAVTVEQLFSERLSDRWVSVGASVIRTLPDDNKGSRHQRFIVETASGHTILVSHNIDLAPRVPLRIGDPVYVRGEYEWNEQGGVVHWTHHDPAGRRAGGWIDHLDIRYR